MVSSSHENHRLRGRRNRAKGIGFERRLAQRFRAAGFDARRILEFDHGAGADIELFATIRPATLEAPPVLFRIPAAIQAKCTKDPADLRRGLFEAEAKNPLAPLRVCIHSCNRRLHVLLSSPELPPREVTWRELLQYLWDLAPSFVPRPISAVNPPLTVSSASPPPTPETCPPDTAHRRRLVNSLIVSTTKP